MGNRFGFSEPEDSPPPVHHPPPPRVLTKEEIEEQERMEAKRREEMDFKKLESMATKIDLWRKRIEGIDTLEAELVSSKKSDVEKSVEAQKIERNAHLYCEELLKDLFFLDEITVSQSHPSMRDIRKQHVKTLQQMMDSLDATRKRMKEHIISPPNVESSVDQQGSRM